MNLIGGLARVFSVIHYGIGVLFFSIFCIGFTETGISTITVLLSIGIVIGYYAYLEFEPQTKAALGEIFSIHPLMTGFSLLWSDFFVGVATGFYFFLKPHWPPEYLSGINIFTAGLAWAAPIVLLFGIWYLFRWIIGGFTQR